MTGITIFPKDNTIVSLLPTQTLRHRAENDGFGQVFRGAEVNFRLRILVIGHRSDFISFGNINPQNAANVFIAIDGCRFCQKRGFNRRIGFVGNPVAAAPAADNRILIEDAVKRKFAPFQR